MDILLLMDILKRRNKMSDRWQRDEDEKFIEITEGRCMNCGNWSDYRLKYYGQYICERCFAESEDEENE